MFSNPLLSDNLENVNKVSGAELYPFSEPLDPEDLLAV